MIRLGNGQGAMMVAKGRSKQTGLESGGWLFFLLGFSTAHLYAPAPSRLALSLSLSLPVPPPLFLLLGFLVSASAPSDGSLLLKCEWPVNRVG
jgi:hypothetical protein